MFKLAVKKSVNYLRPLITGKLLYNSNYIENCITSLIVLNENGDILTTATNADLILNAIDIREIYQPILKELKGKNPRQIKKIEEKYGINSDSIVAMNNIIVDAVDFNGKTDIIKHKNLDLAVIKGNGNSHVTDFPIFISDFPEVGTSICSIGFAFPEYDAFKYDDDACLIKNTNKFMNFPIFPTTGIITRNIADSSDQITMLETSNAVIPGQNGGVLTDQSGDILGILISSKTLSPTKNINVTLGYAINSKTVMEFLDNNNIKYNMR